MEREVDIEDIYRNLNAHLLGDENYNIFMSALDNLSDEEVELLSRMIWWNKI